MKCTCGEIALILTLNLIRLLDSFCVALYILTQYLKVSVHIILRGILWLYELYQETSVDSHARF
jgi:hypothetical protein